MTYRFLVADAVTRLPVAELSAIQSVSWKESLNSPGEFSCTIPLVNSSSSNSNSDLTALRVFDDGSVMLFDDGTPMLFDSSGSSIISNPSVLSLSMFKQPRAIFLLEKDGVIIMGGPIKTHSINPEANTFQFQGSGYQDYLRRWKLRITKTYVGIDQSLIVKDLIDYKQAIPFYDLGINTSLITATNYYRDRTYYGYERKWIGVLIEQLTGVENGFDWALYPRWSAGPNSQITIVPYVGFPNTGRDIGLVLDYGANCSVTAFSSSDETLGYAVDEIGLGTGSTQLIATIVNQTLLSQSIGVDIEDSRFDVSHLPTLEAYGRLRLLQGQVPKDNVTVRVGPEFLGSILVGDRARLKVNAGLLVRDEPFRIVEIAGNITSNGVEEVILTLAPMGMFI